MVHRVLKSVSRVVRMSLARDCPKMVMARRIRRNEALEPKRTVRGPATSLTILVMKSVPQTRFRWSAAVSLVRDDDECEAHAAFSGGI